MEGNYLDLLSAALFRCNQKYYDKVLSEYGLSYSGLIFLISIYEDEGLMLNRLAQDGGFDKGSIPKVITSWRKMVLYISLTQKKIKEPRNFIPHKRQEI